MGITESINENAGYTNTIQNQKWNIVLVLKGIWILGNIVMGCVMLTSNLFFKESCSGNARHWKSVFFTKTGGLSDGGGGDALPVWIMASGNLFNG